MFKNKVGRPSNEVIKKRRILNIVLIAIIFVVLFSLTYMLTNITTKKLTGGGPTYYGISCKKVTGCYQAGFRNGNLYQRVIDRYNSENNASLSYEEVITDEQLLSITQLGAEEGNIDDVTGIEKLVNLESLSLSENNLSSIDLSNLTNLEELDLSNNSISEIDLSNTNLYYLSLEYNNITSIDLSNNTNLEELDLSNNNISEINLSNLTNLEELYLAFTNISEINLSNLTNLERLDLSNNNISEIDLSSNTILRYLILSNNNLSQINLDNLHGLEKLVLDNNYLSTIDLSNNSNIEGLSLDIDLYSLVNFDNFNNLYEIENEINMLPGDAIDISVLSNLYDYSYSDFRGEDEVYSYNDGVITALSFGFDQINYYSGSLHVQININVFSQVLSNKYEIDNEEKYIYVGHDNDDEILENTSADYDVVCEVLEFENLNECLEKMEESGYFYGVVVNKDNLKLRLNNGHEDYNLKYKLGRINLNNYEVSDKTITSASFDVNDIRSYNVLLEYDDNTLTVKDLKGNVVDTYTVVSGNNNNNPGNNIDDNNNDNNNNDNNNNDNNNNDNNDTTTSKTTLNKFDDNAKTYDNIMYYFIICGISILLIVGIIIYTKKKK